MTDYDELVARLRSDSGYKHDDPRIAAGAIETLRTQYAAYRKITKDAIDNLVRERDEARAECKALELRERSLEQRAEAAEAEVQRLNGLLLAPIRAALEAK